jgi:hypothetical protein
VELEF